jgi:hypothetical protein
VANGFLQGYGIAESGIELFLSRLSGIGELQSGSIGRPVQRPVGIQRRIGYQSASQPQPVLCAQVVYSLSDYGIPGIVPGLGIVDLVVYQRLEALPETLIQAWGPYGIHDFTSGTHASTDLLIRAIGMGRKFEVNVSAFVADLLLVVLPGGAFFILVVGYPHALRVAAHITSVLSPFPT